MTVAAPREVFWADAEAALLAPGRRHTIRDSKTPSGAVPISGLRGPVITSALFTAAFPGSICSQIVVSDPAAGLSRPYSQN